MISIERKFAAVGEFGTYLSKTEAMNLKIIHKSLHHGLNVLSSVLFHLDTTDIDFFRVSPLFHAY